VKTTSYGGLLVACAPPVSALLTVTVTLPSSASAPLAAYDIWASPLVRVANEAVSDVSVMALALVSP